MLSKLPWGGSALKGSQGGEKTPLESNVHELNVGDLESGISEVIHGSACSFLACLYLSGFAVCLAMLLNLGCLWL